MKKFLTLIVLLYPLTLHAEALFENGIEPGYFVGPYSQITTLNNSVTAMMGLEGAFLANSSWMIGLSGATLITSPEFTTGFPPDSNGFVLDSLKNIKMNLAGVKLGYIANPSWLIHWLAGGQIGGGKAKFYTPSDRKMADSSYESKSSSFFFLEPEIGAEVNITNSLRFGASVTYRMVAWSEENYGINSMKLSGPGVKFFLHYGIMSPGNPKPRPPASKF